MKKNKEVYVALSIAAAFFISAPCLAQPADNTGTNKRDASPRAITASQQGETAADREITKKIRRAIVNDKSLSTNAHNVKIITMEGMVILKGPVGSEREKLVIEEKAYQIAGSDKVTSEIEIAPNKESN